MTGFRTRKKVAMRYKKFGNSELETSVVGFGGWPMGRGHYGSFDDDEVVRAVHASIDLGVTLFDTAAVYGWGEGEKLLGRALEGKREDVVIVSKAGIPWDEEGGGRRRDSSRESLEKSLNESLTRLQTDYLDLFLIHWPDESRPMSVPMDAFADFQKQGKIRYGGVSNFSPQQMSDCLDVFPVVTNQVGYHLFDQRPEPEIIPFCADNGMGIMAYGSLAHGLLTGTMTPDTTFEEDDWRRSLMAFGQPIFKGQNFLDNLKKVDTLKEMAAERGFSVAQLALAWVASEPTVSVALVGTRKPEEIQENVAAADWELSLSERAEIRAVVTG
ncbi:MAG: aldo/keto reductase [Dehalococcoidia bacterium]|nr:aldo/keto reductase [Dehalococcoidia bacterium]